MIDIEKLAKEHNASLEKLRDIHKIQGHENNWSYDDYMRGLYNGLELALATFENRAPEYKEAEKQREQEPVGYVWDKDKKYCYVIDTDIQFPHGTKLYTTPPDQSNSIEVLTRDYNFMKDLAIGSEKIITDLQAHVNRLREALLQASRHLDLLEPSLTICKIISEALASTPAQSLQAHDDELLEQCAKLCENQWDVDSAAASIRNLKGQE